MNENNEEEQSYLSEDTPEPIEDDWSVSSLDEIVLDDEFRPPPPPVLRRQNARIVGYSPHEISDSEDEEEEFGLYYMNYITAPPPPPQ